MISKINTIFLAEFKNKCRQYSVEMWFASMKGRQTIAHMPLCNKVLNKDSMKGKL